MSPGTRTLALLLAVLTVAVSSDGTCTIQYLNDTIKICVEPGLKSYEIKRVSVNGSLLLVSVFDGRINHNSMKQSGACYETPNIQFAKEIYINDKRNGRINFKPCTGVHSSTATSIISSITTDPPETTTNSILSVEPTTANSTSENDKAVNVTDLTNGIVVGIVITVVIVVGCIVFVLYKRRRRQTQTRSRDREAPQVRQVHPGRTQNNIGMEALDDRSANVNLTEEASSENRNGVNGHAGNEGSALLPPERHGRTQNNIEMETRADRSEDVNPAEEASSELMMDQSH